MPIDSPVIPCPLANGVPPGVVIHLPPPNETPVDKLTLSCCHGRTCPEHTEDNIFEIVPSTKSVVFYDLTDSEAAEQGIDINNKSKKNRYKYIDTVTAVWTGPNIPRSLGINADGKNSNIEGGGNYVLKLSIDPKDFEAYTNEDGEKKQRFILMRSLIRFSVRTQFREYHIMDVPAGYSPVTVRVYNPEKFKLTFSVPSLKSYSSGNKLEMVDGKVKMEEEASTSKTLDSTLISGTRYSLNDSAVKRDSAAMKMEATDNVAKEEEFSSIDNTYIEKSINEDAQRKTKLGLTSAGNITGMFRIEKDGVQEGGVISDLNSVAKILSAIKGIWDALPNKPSIGFYVDLQVSVLQGNMAISWGWQEEGNATACYHVQTSGKLVIFSVALEFGFGLSAIVIKAQVFAKCSGEISMEGELDYTWRMGDKTFDDKGREGDRINISGTIGFCIGVRFNVVYLINVELTLNSDLVASGSFTVETEQVCKMQVDLTFTGIYLKVEVCVGALAAYAIRKATKKDKGKSGNQYDHSDEVLTKDTSEQARWQLYPPKRLKTYILPSSDETLSLDKKIKETDLAKRMEEMLDGKKILGDEGKPIVIKKKKDSKSWLAQKSESFRTETVDSYSIAEKLAKKAITKNIDFEKGLDLFLLNIRKSLRTLTRIKPRFSSDYYAYADVEQFIDGVVYDKVLANNEDPLLDLVAKSGEIA